MKTKLVISELKSNESIELKETQQKQLQGGQTILQWAKYPQEGSFLIFQIHNFQP